VTGIESPLIQLALGQDLWRGALEARKLVVEGSSHTIQVDAVGMAINSVGSRTQDQLHIHVDCVRSEVRTALREHASAFADVWRPLSSLLPGTPFWGIRLPGRAGFNPFEVLSRMPGGGDMRDVAAAVFSASNSDEEAFYLLAYRAHGSQTERLLDHACGVAT